MQEKKSKIRNERIHAPHIYRQMDGPSGSSAKFVSIRKFGVSAPIGFTVWQ
jgi:hypothetical protein